jgi:hypothetical protein
VDALAIVPDDAAIAGELAGIRKRKKRSERRRRSNSRRFLLRADGQEKEIS